MCKVKNLKLRDVHLANPWRQGLPGRILQVRGSGGGGPGIPFEKIVTGMHVKVGEQIDAILVLSGGQPGEMISSAYWNDAAIDVTGEVEIVAAAGVAPAAPRFMWRMTLGALYRHEKEPAFFVYAELDPNRTFKGVVCVASWTDRWAVGTCPQDLKTGDLALIAEKVGISKVEDTPSSPRLAEAAE